MTDMFDSSRRKALKLGAAALVALPALGLAGRAFAAQNADVRKALAYQDTPNGDKNCANCVNFQPATNGCTLMPGDDEIKATGYCSGWVAKS